MLECPKVIGRQAHEERLVNLLILNGPADPNCSGTYKGTFRAHPSYHSELPRDHAVNQAFYRFLELGGESGVIHDLEQARNIVSQYSHVDPPIQFSIVEAVSPLAAPILGRQFLGIDLSCGLGNSLLSWGLVLSSSAIDVEGDSIVATIEPLLRLIERYFKPLLNVNGLFDKADDAAFCLECMLSLQSLVPNLFENDEHSGFQPISLYLVE